jgi:hypothetical protein
MKKHALIIGAVAAAAALGAYALSRFGRSAAAGELSAGYGDQSAKDIAASLSLSEAVFAGARKVLGQNAFPEDKRSEIYVAFRESDGNPFNNLPS